MKNGRRLYGKGIALGLVIFLCGGCGYTYKSTVLHNIKTIAVPTFKNALSERNADTYSAGLDVDVTNAVIDRFNYDGSLKVVSPDKADVILEGTLTAFNQDTIRYGGHGDVKEYRLFIGVDLSLVDARTGTVMWTEKNFRGRTEYIRSSSGSISERAAVKAAREDLAKKIVDRVVEDW